MMFRNIAHPTVIVEFLGEAEHRVGSKPKYKCVAYREVGQSLITTRQIAEFLRLFAPIHEQPKHD